MYPHYNIKQAVIDVHVHEFFGNDLDLRVMSSCNILVDQPKRVALSVLRAYFLITELLVLYEVYGSYCLCCVYTCTCTYVYIYM